MANPIDIVFVFISVLVLGVTSITKPSTARCPKGWSLSTGIRRSGDFSCWPAPVGGNDDVLTGRQTAIQPPGELRGKIYCTGGTEPIVGYDGVSVGCQRGGWKP